VSAGWNSTPSASRSGASALSRSMASTTPGGKKSLTVMLASSTPDDTRRTAPRRLKTSPRSKGAPKAARTPEAFIRAATPASSIPSPVAHRPRPAIGGQLRVLPGLGQQLGPRLAAAEVRRPVEDDRLVEMVTGVSRKRIRWGRWNEPSMRDTSIDVDPGSSGPSPDCERDEPSNRPVPADATNFRMRASSSDGERAGSRRATIDRHHHDDDARQRAPRRHPAPSRTVPAPTAPPYLPARRVRRPGPARVVGSRRSESAEPFGGWGRGGQTPRCARGDEVLASARASTARRSAGERR
jgi:hypothetical protein